MVPSSIFSTNKFHTLEGELKTNGSTHLRLLAISHRAKKRDKNQKLEKNNKTLFPNYLIFILTMHGINIHFDFQVFPTPSIFLEIFHCITGDFWPQMVEFY